LSPRYGLIAAAANIDLLAIRLDRLNMALFDDTDEPELRHPAFDSLSEELSDMHALALDVRDGIQRLLDKELGTP
jgi:hypothetical protein